MHFFEALLLSLILSIVTAEPELPLCPTNIQFLPQNLPMHCRMPTNADLPFPKGPELPQVPTMPPFIPPFYQSPPPDGQPPPIPIPVPGMPPFPGGMMPPMMPPPMLPPPPGPMHKLPVIVMPFYSPDPSYKKPEKGPRDKPIGIKKKKHKKKFHSDYSSDTDISSDTSGTDTITTTDTETDSTSSDTSRERRWWGKGIGRSKNTRRMMKRQRRRKNKQRNNKKDFLTPILQYVTDDGYVIFEKKISKGEAKDWLGEKAGNEIEDLNADHKNLSNEEALNRSKVSNPAPVVPKAKKHHQKPPVAAKPRPPK